MKKLQYGLKVTIVLILSFLVNPISGFCDMNDDLIKACDKGDAKKVAALIKQGADVNFIGKSGKDKLDNSPLDIAIYKVNFALLKVLVDNKADVNATNQMDSPLEGLCKLEKVNDKNRIKLVEYLLKNGAKLTPDAFVNACGSASVDLVKFLIKSGASINKQAENGSRYFPIHAAVHSENMPVLQFLIKSGADINTPISKDCKFCTPVAYATINEKSKKALDVLIKAGANLAEFVQDGARKWWLCNENGADNVNCINQMQIAFSNIAPCTITSITFELTIKNENAQVLYSKQHTASVNLTYGKTDEGTPFKLIENVYEKTTDFADVSKIKAEVRIISAK